MSDYLVIAAAAHPDIITNIPISSQLHIQRILLFSLTNLQNFMTIFFLLFRKLSTIPPRK